MNKTMILLAAILLCLCLFAPFTSAEESERATRLSAGTVDLGPVLRSYVQEAAQKAAIQLQNNEPIRFETANGTLDGTEIRRFGGNALRIRYAASSMIFDSLDDLPLEVRDSAGTPVFRIDPVQHAYLRNGGNLGIGRIPAAGVKVDIQAENKSVGLRYLRTDAKDARIQVGDPTQTWSLATGWATAGDFSIIEELVSGDRLYIQRGGNVGISTSQPSERLEVNGNIKLSGNLVSDGDICIGSGCP